jgi:hypothetical protein
MLLHWPFRCSEKRNSRIGVCNKGRLPLDNEAIDKALEVGLDDCLRQLQKSNPTLLLTASQLRVLERDYRYIPAVAEALSRMVNGCSNQTRRGKLVSMISRWQPPQRTSQGLVIRELTRHDNEDGDGEDDDASSSTHQSTAPELSIEMVQGLIESRLRLAVSCAETRKKPTRANSLLSQEKHRARRGLGLENDHNRIDDPADVVDRCTEWAEAFVDLQDGASDDGQRSPDGTTRQKLDVANGMDECDDWL